jgi:hypothetical protein
MLRRPDVLAKFRGPGWCHVCGKYCKRRAACHIYTTGAGRVDHPVNLYSAGAPGGWDCTCHADEHHEGAKKWRARLEAIAAKREKTVPESVFAVVSFFRWLHRRRLKREIDYRLQQLDAEPLRLILPYLEQP